MGPGSGGGGGGVGRVVTYVRYRGIKASEVRDFALKYASRPPAHVHVVRAPRLPTQPAPLRVGAEDKRAERILKKVTKQCVSSHTLGERLG